MNDIINGLFETFGSLFILLSIVKLARDKVVRGVSWLHMAFFTAWGYWNIWFYHALDMPYSWWGGLLVTAMNTVWLAQLLYYRNREEVKFAATVQEAVDLMHAESDAVMADIERQVLNLVDSACHQRNWKPPKDN